MVRPLILGLLKGRMFFFNNANADVRVVFNAVDFVKRHPVFHFMPVPFKGSGGKPKIKKQSPDGLASHRIP